MAIHDYKFGSGDTAPFRLKYDTEKNLYTAQWYDSVAGAYKDVLQIDGNTKEIKIFPTSNIDISIDKSIPKIILKGEETGGIETQVKEDAGAVSIEDITNAKTLLKLLGNTPVEFDVAVPVIFETAQTGKAADATGVKFTSKSIIPALMHYAKSAAIEATWSASDASSATPSITAIELFDEDEGTAGAVIVKVEDNSGTDVKSTTYEPITEGHKLVVRVHVTTAGAANTTVDCSKAVVYFRVSLA